MFPVKVVVVSSLSNSNYFHISRWSEISNRYFFGQNEKFPSIRISVELLPTGKFQSKSGKPAIVNSLHISSTSHGLVHQAVIGEYYLINQWQIELAFGVPFNEKLIGILAR